MNTSLGGEETVEVVGQGVVMGCGRERRGSGHDDAEADGEVAVDRVHLEVEAVAGTFG